MPPAEFHAFGPSHTAVLGICAVLFIVMFRLRQVGLPAAVWLERTLGALLLLCWPLTLLMHWRLGSLSLDRGGLPFHFCDVAGMASGLVLLTRHRLAAEIAYFFGLAGTLQGLITPNLFFDFPDPRFVTFFLLHGGVVVSALHAVTALGCSPRQGAVPRMICVTLAYAAFAALINKALGTNFGFLCHKPDQASLMDSLGPWPWYIGSMVILCGVFYSVLNAPFALTRRRQR